MPELKVVQGPGAPRGILLPLGEEEWVLGTGPSCQVVLEDAAIRDRHVRIRRRGLSYVIEPLQEGFGFELNGRDAESSIPLQEGDEIQLGQTVMRWSPGDAIEAVAMGISLEDSMTTSGIQMAPGGMVELRPYVGTELTADVGAGFHQEASDVVTGDHLMDAVTQTIQSLRAGTTIPEASLASLTMAFAADRALLYLPFGGQKPRLVSFFLGPAELGPEEGITPALLTTVQEAGIPVVVNVSTATVQLPEQVSVGGAGSLRSLMTASVPTAGGEGSLVLDAPLGRKRFTEQDLAVLTSFATTLSHLLGSASRIARMEELIENWSASQARFLCHIPEGPEGLEERLADVAASRKPVLLIGEPGAGKRTAALRLHRLSRRGAEPVVVVDCAAEDDLPGAVFGRLEEGDSRSVTTGALDDADRGTLVLANATALPMAIQSRLQRYLESGCFETEGVAAERSSEARLVITSDRDPTEEGGGGWFHSALLKRFSVRRRVRVPPLREEPEFLERTAEKMVRAVARRFKKRVLGLDEEARQLLFDHAWSGNHHELRWTLQVAVRDESRERLGRAALARALGLEHED